MEDKHPDVFELLGQADLRYLWSILKCFNQHYGTAIPFIDQTQSIELPANALPMSIAAYLSCVKELGLSDIKCEMRYLILDKTSLKVEEPPVVSYDRLKLAAEDEQRQNDGSEKPVEPKPHSSDQFVFSVVAKQMKDMDYS